MPPADLADPWTDEFLAHPNFRQVAAFLLGWVFLASLSYMTSSIIMHTLISRFIHWISHHPQAVPDHESTITFSEKIRAEDTRSAIVFKGENQSLVFTLSLCFAFASLANFASLLSFQADGGTACAFVVAWGGMASQAARLFGLILLILELRQFGVARWEYILFWCMLMAGLVFAFVTNAIATGTITPTRQLSFAFCYRKRFLPTSLANSIIYFLLELHLLVRMISFTAPAFLQIRHQLAGLSDVRVVRALSLMLLELLTIVPSSTNTNVLGDFIPFSIGAICVLVSFNYQRREVKLPAMDVIPPSFASRSERFTSLTPLSRRSLSSKRNTRLTQLVKEWRPNSLAPSSRSRSIDSEYARSVRDAVVQLARNRHRSELDFANLPTPNVKKVEIDQNPEPAFQTPILDRRIMANQAAYAYEVEEIKEEPTLSIGRPPLKVDTGDRTIVYHGDPASSQEMTSPGSIFYGSDIIRIGSEHRRQDVTKKETPSEASGYRTSYEASTIFESMFTVSHRSSLRRSTIMADAITSPGALSAFNDLMSPPSATSRARWTQATQSISGRPPSVTSPRSARGLPSPAGPRPPPTSFSPSGKERLK